VVEYKVGGGLKPEEIQNDKGKIKRIIEEELAR